MPSNRVSEACEGGTSGRRDAYLIATNDYAGSVAVQVQDDLVWISLAENPAYGPGLRSARASDSVWEGDHYTDQSSKARLNHGLVESDT